MLEAVKLVSDNLESVKELSINLLELKYLLFDRDKFSETKEFFKDHLNCLDMLVLEFMLVIILFKL